MKKCKLLKETLLPKAIHKISKNNLCFKTKSKQKVKTHQEITSHNRYLQPKTTILK